MHFDVVITDFVMAKLNGLNFVKQLRALKLVVHNLYNKLALSAISRDAILEDGQRFFRSL